MGALRRLVSIGFCVSLSMSLVACNGDTAALEKAAARLAETQKVDESAVRKTLQSYSHSETEQLRLAKAWESQLPQKPVPNLAVTANQFNSVAEKAAEELLKQACSAVLDIIRTHQVPDAQTFANKYMKSKLLSALPGSELLAIGIAFQGLWHDAESGDLTTNDVRLTLMKFQYCSRVID